MSRIRDKAISSATPILYYVRHGQTNWNAEFRFQGRRDIPLNDFGRSQAKLNGQKLRAKVTDFSGHIFISSPMDRARETMEIIRSQIGLEPSDYKTDERLIEISYGDFEGRTKAELKAENRETFLARKSDPWEFKPNNGESHRESLERVKEWYESLLPGQKYLVTAHGAIGRVLRIHVLGLDILEAAKFTFPQDEVFLFQDGEETRF